MPEIETIFRKLEGVKEEISSAKQEKDQKIGQLSEQMKVLQTHKVKAIPEAQKKVTVLQKKSKSWENKIITNFEKLQEHYEW